MSEPEHPRCMTCKYWGPNQMDNPRAAHAEMGACRSPRLVSDILDITRDRIADGATIDCGDGEQVLVTGRHFGCIHHEAKP